MVLSPADEPGIGAQSHQEFVGILALDRPGMRRQFAQSIRIICCARRQGVLLVILAQQGGVQNLTSELREETASRIEGVAPAGAERDIPNIAGGP
jgi:hypothetical protein